MRAGSVVYPSLGRYFSTVTEIANAACMKRDHCWRCLNGINGKDFTPQEKKAIVANIIVRMERGEIGNNYDREILDMYQAFDDFDTVFRKGIA